jgi:hypothetical protein
MTSSLGSYITVVSLPQITLVNPSPLLQGEVVVMEIVPSVGYTPSSEAERSHLQLGPILSSGLRGRVVANESS